jgi:hypothetical protein
MGTASTKKIIKNNAGTLTEEAALLTSAGAGDANRVPALNASGVLDATIVNSKGTSAGAGDVGKLPSLDAAGKLDTSFMPTGIGADTSSIVSSENLAAGYLVNIWNNAAVANVRKADATVAGKEAHGFVLAAVTAPAAATVYFEGSNTGVTGLTPGPQFLSATAGLCTATAPSAAGNVVQRVGFATSATNMNFQSQTPVVLA